MAELRSRYRIERRLGAGGMAEVFLAWDTQLERSVALKVLPAELAADTDKRKRFLSATKAASALTHPNICIIHEVGETEDGRPFLAMEFVEGEPLDVILAKRALRVPEVIDIGMQVAEALDAAHARGILHRDIKPANILVGPRGQVKVLDFGLAKRFGGEALSATSSTVYQTQDGVMIGTPHYMSPEQVLGRELDGRTDIFSLGVVLYEALAGQKPFLGRTAGEVLNNVVNQEPQPLGLDSPIYSPALDGILFKCLQKDPQRRYASARALADALAGLKAKSKAVPKEKTTGALAGAPAAGNAAPSRPQTRQPGWAGQIFSRASALGGIGLVVLLGVAGLVLLRPWDTGTSGSRAAASANPAIAQKSVAVLPFNNFSSDRDSDYLGDGFTEEITAALSRIPGLKVAARNSAFTFKGKSVDARVVGRVLGVTTLLEGSIRTEGNRVRISAQLVNVATGYHLWSETFDRPLDDILAVQQEIAQRIAERLQGKPLSAMRQPRAVNPEAYTVYLQGRMAWNKRSPTGLKRAAELFQDALEKDPTYAAAQAGLASTYLLMPEYVFTARSTEFHPLAKAAAERALQLDTNCVEAHAVLGMLKTHKTEAKEAEEHFRRAIELNPNDATARHWYGNFLLFRGRGDEALTEYKAALELDPLSRVAHATLAQWYYYTQDYDTAALEARKAMEKFPSFVRVREILVMALIQKGDFEQALKEIEEARPLEPESPLILLEYRAYSLARLGREDEARAIQAQFEEVLRQGQPAEGRLMLVYAGLRDYDKLLDMLELKQSTEGLDPMILKDPMTREFRDLPRFKELMQRAGMEPPPQKRT